VWISHDLGVIGQGRDDVTCCTTAKRWSRRRYWTCSDRPQQPHTRELLDARPLVGGSGPPPAPEGSAVLLDVDGLDVRFPVTTPVGRTTIHAVKELSFQIPARHHAWAGRRVGVGQVDRGAALTDWWNRTPAARS